jgi:hypothetical protein
VPGWVAEPVVDGDVDAELSCELRFELADLELDDVANLAGC